MTADETLAAVEALQPQLRARAAEIESARRLPSDLVEALERAGCHRLFAPPWITGRTIDVRGALRIIEAVSTADGSAGWTVSQYALGQLIAAHLGRTALDAIYAHGPDARIAGVFAPKGHATRGANGWHVSGQWPFASGCESAAWIYVQSVVTEKRRVVMRGALPETRLAVIPAAEVEIVDTWDAVGLRGTGSHDVRVKRDCADEWTCALADTNAVSGTMPVPLLDHAGLLIAAVTAGIAGGAIDDVARLAASGKRPAFSARSLADDPVFHDRLGEAQMRLLAARALLDAQAAMVEAAVAGKMLSDVERASLRATAQQVTALAVDAADAAYALARSSAIASTSPLQRRMRDLHTATQHAWNGRDFLQALGALLAARG